MEFTLDRHLRLAQARS